MRGTSSPNRVLLRKERHRLTEMNRRKRVCVECRSPYLPVGSRASRCSRCYPIYRKAVNLLASARHRSRTACNLTIEWIEERIRLGCPRTGLKFVLQDGPRKAMTPSLDQINLGNGYTKRNVQVVSWWYNAAKQAFSDTEVITLCTLVAQQHSSAMNRALPVEAETTLGDTRTAGPGALVASTMNREKGRHFKAKGNNT